MTYCCDHCGFLFSRIGAVSECPMCEDKHFRAATPQEAECLKNY